jgi:hypothetical protein
MKTILPLFFLSFSLFSAAHADLSCLGENNDTLTIKYTPSRVGKVVKAHHTIDGKTSEYKGFQDTNLPSINLMNNSGDSAELKVVKQVFHGGRCGRCTPDPIEQGYFAKLIINQQTEYNFSCTLF